MEEVDSICVALALEWYHSDPLDRHHVLQELSRVALRSPHSAKDWTEWAADFCADVTRSYSKEIKC